MTAHIGLNALFLVPGVVGGSEYSTVSSLLALADAPPPDVRYTLFGLEALVDAHPELVTDYEVVPLSISGGRKPLRVAAESTWLATQLRRRGVDVTHHLGGTVPVVAMTPSVLTIHDLQPLDKPESFSRVRVAYLRATLPRSARTARVVVTPSEFVRRTVISRFDLDPSNVVAVHHGVAPPAVVLPRDEIAARYGLGSKWIVLPAVTLPHKNHRTLLDAFAPLAAEDPDVHLVLTGGAGAAEVEVLQRAALPDLAGRVRRTGRVPRADVDSLVAHASVLAFPSRYEGFGLPVLEGMACGVPVVASDIPAIEEIAGDAAVLVDPDDVDGWTAALRRLLADAGERQRLAAAGPAHAATFTWARTAAGIAAVHQRAAATA